MATTGRKGATPHSLENKGKGEGVCGSALLKGACRGASIPLPLERESRLLVLFERVVCAWVLREASFALSSYR